MLPNYDSAANDFSFATIYTENAFSGADRISDTNALTLGVTSRLIDPGTGVEAVRFGIAQRFRFADQKVTLPGLAPVTDRTSDLLLGAQINWTPKWSLDTLLQYNPDSRRSTRSAISARYNPGPYRNLSAAFRYQAPSTPTATDGNKSIDFGWQWPLNDLWGDKGKDLGPGKGEGGGRWYAVGRLNYSLQDKKLTDGVLGVEYDGCCSDQSRGAATHHHRPGHGQHPHHVPARIRRLLRHRIEPDAGFAAERAALPAAASTDRGAEPLHQLRLKRRPFTP